MPANPKRDVHPDKWARIFLVTSSVIVKIYKQAKQKMELMATALCLKEAPSKPFSKIYNDTEEMRTHEFRYKL